MIRTYIGTLFHPDLVEAEFELFLTDKVKYECKGLDEDKCMKYTGVKSWSIVEGGKEAEEIEKDLGDGEMDENHEYLILTFEDDTKATYRNSHVVMFIN